MLAEEVFYYYRKVNWITVFDSSSCFGWPLSAGNCSQCNFQSVISSLMASCYGTYKSIADVNFLGADSSIGLSPRRDDAVITSKENCLSRFEIIWSRNEMAGFFLK